MITVQLKYLIWYFLWTWQAFHLSRGIKWRAVLMVSQFCSFITKVNKNTTSVEEIGTTTNLEFLRWRHSGGYAWKTHTKLLKLYSQFLQYRIKCHWLLHCHMGLPQQVVTRVWFGRAFTPDALSDTIPKGFASMAGIERATCHLPSKWLDDYTIDLKCSCLTLYTSL